MNMKNENKYHLSRRELALLRWKRSISQSRLTDIEVHGLYIKELRSRYQKATVFWPAAGDRLLPDQISQLKAVLQSVVVTVFIPITNRFYWNFIVLERKKACPGEWMVKKVETSEDDLSGKHTVTQSMQILDQGLEAYSVNHPNQVSALNRSDAIYAQIEQILNTGTDNGSSTIVNTATNVTNTATQNNDVSIVTGAANLKVKYRSRFDFQLEKLAEYAALGYSLENLCQELAQILADMAPQTRESAIKRLALSDLARKPAVARVIDSCNLKQPKIFTNPYLLIPKPKSKSDSSLKEEQSHQRHVQCHGNKRKLFKFFLPEFCRNQGVTRGHDLVIL